jgi:hypothetical protein
LLEHGQGLIELLGRGMGGGGGSGRERKRNGRQLMGNGECGMGMLPAGDGGMKAEQRKTEEKRTLFFKKRLISLIVAKISNAHRRFRFILRGIYLSGSSI